MQVRIQPRELRWAKGADEGTLTTISVLVGRRSRRRKVIVIDVAPSQGRSHAVARGGSNSVPCRVPLP
jgi:hypothetical protein